MNNNMTINNTIANPIELPADTATEKSLAAKIRSFLPLSASLGWVLGFTLGHIPFFETFSLVLILVGVLCAFTVAPLKLLALPFKMAAGGFTLFRSFIPFYGVGDLVAALLGTSCGFFAGLAVICMAPAFFTIRKYLND